MSFTITCNGTTVPIALDGFARIKNSLGAHLFQEENDTFSLVLSNGWVNHQESIGGTNWDAITLNCPFPVATIPRINHAAGTNSPTNGVLIIGTENGVPHNYMPPRWVHVVRFAKVTVPGNLFTPEIIAEAVSRILNRPFRRGNSPFVCAPNALAHLKAQYDTYGDELLKCLRDGVGNQDRDVWTNALGYLHPIGITRGDRPGGEGIDATPGWSRSSKHDLVSMDMRMDRTPVAWIDSATGKPILQQRPEYTGYRTWNKSGVFFEFVMPRSLSPWEDERLPRDVNQGTCSYRGSLVPVEFTNGQGQKEWTYPFEADDVAHLVRATAHLKACRDLYRDKAAALCLQMVAADAWAAWKPRAVARGVGLSGPLRGTGWTLDALHAAGFEAQAGLVVRNLNAAQMVNGFWQNWPLSEASGMGSPNPWVSGMDSAMNAAQGKENCYTALAMARYGEVAAAGMCMHGMYGDHFDPDIWQGVAQGANIFKWPANASNVGKDHHQHWGALGVLARLDKSWLRTAQKLVPPDGPGPLGPNMIHVLAANPYPEGVACLIEACER